MTKTIQAIYSDGQIRPLEPLELPDGTSLQIVVDVPSAAGKPGQQGSSEAAWDVFRSLGSDAQPGRLADPSIKHDRYLYGDPQ